MGEGPGASYSALPGFCVNGSVWSVRICWVEVLWNEFNGRAVATRFCLLMDATKNKGWADGPGRFAGQGSSALRMQHPLERGGGRHSPRERGPTGRHDKRQPLQRWSLGRSSSGEATTG